MIFAGGVRWWLRGAALITGAVLVYACREPTQVTLTLTTDAACGGAGFRGATIAVATPESLRRKSAEASTSSCSESASEASIGSLVIVPSGADDDPFAVRVVAGIGVSASDCPAPDYVLGADDTKAGRGCIVARRSLAFVPHEPLSLPVVLRASCLNVSCLDDQTCVQGRCVSASVDPEDCAREGGCTEESLGGGGGFGAGGAGAMGGGGMGAAGGGGMGAGGGGGMGAAGGAGGATGGVTFIEAGATYSCAIHTTGAHCWGTNPHGAWDAGAASETPSPPVPVMTSLSNGSPVVELAAGRQHLCARIASGGVYCAGNNQLGQVDPTSMLSSFDVAQPVPFMGAASALGAGEDHSCAALVGGLETACWGRNDLGQVSLATIPLPEVAYQPVGATALAAGANHSCGLTPTGVVCWGSGIELQVGAGGGGSLGPTVVMDPDNPVLATQVSAGTQHSCAVDLARDVRCWGSESAAAQQFGDGSIVSIFPSALFTGTGGVDRIDTRRDATCAVRDGEVGCWGRFADGRSPADGSTGAALVWTPLSIPEAVMDVAVGDVHACALTVMGRVLCWGSNPYGQVSDDNVGPAPVFPPVLVQPN